MAAAFGLWNAYLHGVDSGKRFCYDIDLPRSKIYQDREYPTRMDISPQNQALAQDSFQIINDCITNCSRATRRIPIGLKIDKRRIVYKEVSAGLGYSFLVFSPATKTGRPAKYPVCLSFMTNLSLPNSVHGNVYYLQDGRIGKAEVCFWKRRVLYHFFVTASDDGLAVSKVETQDVRGEAYRAPTVIFRAK